MCIYVRTLGLNIWEVLMKIEEYLQLLSEGKVDEARKVRFSTIPSKLIKFIWLDESEKDEKKFLSLQREEIWFAQKDLLNDPYEYKGILLDRKKLSEAGYSPDVIEKYQTLFDFSDYGITCLSSNNIWIALLVLFAAPVGAPLLVALAAVLYDFTPKPTGTVEFE